ncbi:hypothetical protein ZTR_07522 [Talaromyces verruculosus]|nr:hypothetical protein ZTR_07522 [Talaromyces verruculosus]
MRRFITRYFLVCILIADTVRHTFDVMILDHGKSSIRNEYQIGWICALNVEAAAAILMLDENVGILQEQEMADTNVYTLGRIGRHYVIIACLPEGQYGTTSATTVANNMMRTFSDSLRIGVMVGISGGAPSAEHDIRLGDVVVSRPEGSHGGVIQHDMGKISKDGKIQRIGGSKSHVSFYIGYAINTVKFSYEWHTKNLAFMRFHAIFQHSMVKSLEQIQCFANH